MKKNRGMIYRSLIVLLVTFSLVSAEHMSPFLSVNASPDEELIQIPASNTINGSRLSEIFDIIKAGFENPGGDRSGTIAAINSLGEICQSYQLPKQVTDFCVKIYYLYKDKESLQRKDLRNLSIESMAEELYGEDAKNRILTEFNYQDVLNDFSTFLSQNTLNDYKKVFSEITDGVNYTTFQDILNARISYFSKSSLEDRAQWIQEKQKRLTEIELDMLHNDCGKFSLYDTNNCNACSDYGEEKECPADGSEHETCVAWNAQRNKVCDKCHLSDPIFNICYLLNEERVDVLADVYGLRYSLNLDYSCLTDSGALHNCLLQKHIIPTPSEWTQTPAPTNWDPGNTKVPTRTPEHVYPNLNDGSGILPTGTPIPWTYVTPGYWEPSGTEPRWYRSEQERDHIQ